MRGLLRIILGLLAVVAAAAALGLVFRNEIAAAGLRWALSRAGVEDPDLKVAAVTLSRIEVADLSAGGDDVSVARLAATYDWRALLSDRRIETLSIGPGALRLTASDEGTLTLAGYDLSGSGGAGEGRPPFDAIEIDALDIEVRAPEGVAAGSIAGSFSPQTGGALAIALTSESLAGETFRIGDAALAADLALADDGGVTLTGKATGDYRFAGWSVRKMDARISASGRSWRDVAEGRAAGVALAGAVDLAAAELAVNENAALAFLSADERQSAPPIGQVAAEGRLEFSRAADGSFELSIPQGEALSVTADRGDRLRITPHTDKALYASAGDERSLALNARLGGGPFTGDVTLSAAQQGDAPWRFFGETAFAAYRLASIDFNDTRAAFEGAYGDGVIEAQATGATEISHARIGRLEIRNAPLVSTFAARIEPDERRMTLTTGGDDCVDVARADITLQGQDSELRFADGSFCNDDGPLALVRWGEGAGADVIGRFDARSMFLRMGQTRFNGAPPRITFDADYDPRSQHTIIKGELSGGRVLLNDALIGSESRGQYEFELDADAMTAGADLESLRVVQNLETLQVAPLLLSGTARLSDEIVTFDYEATTMKRRPLGAGAGRHALATGRGQTRFSAERLVFAPGALQPAGVILALKGIIGDATGVAGAVVDFAWGRGEDDFASSGVFTFDDLTFIGPGLVFTGTRGVSGEVRLTNLRPLTTDGLQEIAIAALDMDALTLETGTLTFSLPGDETIVVEEAVFPWFGGVLGVYGATASLAGGEAEIPLRIDNANVAQILDYVDVDGLEGEGLMSGVLPLVIEGGKARIVDGELHALGPGAIRYRGAVSESAGQAGQQAEVAFSILRDLRFKTLTITVNGPLDGTIDFTMFFEGTGEVPVNRQRVRVPVKYTINLDAALLDLLNQARLSRSIELQIERGLSGSGPVPE